MGLIGKDIFTSKEIEAYVQQIVTAIEKQNQKITGPKPPNDEMKSYNDDLIKKVNQSRGRPLFYPYIGSGAGRGPYVELSDGSVKLDLINGIGIHILGHSHPEVTAATIRGGLSDIVMQGNLQPNREYQEISEKVIALAGRKSRLKHMWLATCGTMANENALKMVRQKNTPARKIIALRNAFAGRSTLMAEISDNAAFKVGLPEYNEVLRLSFFQKKDNRSIEKTTEEMRKHIAENKGNISAFMFEPMQGEGGYNVAPREYFLPLFELCRQNKIAIWADEVQTFCRTGEFFAFETLGIGEYIDICTIAKTLQNGATLYTEEYNPQPGLIAGTFSGSSATLTAGIEVLKILETQNYMGPEGKIKKIHTQFISMLNRLNETSCKGLLQDAGGMGLMIAVTPLDGSKEKSQELLKVLFKNGMMSFGCGHGPHRLRFLVPAVMTEKDIGVAEKILEKSILELA